MSPKAKKVSDRKNECDKREFDFASKFETSGEKNPDAHRMFLESLADLLIDNAERDGTISTDKRRTAITQAA